MEHTTTATDPKRCPCGAYVLTEVPTPHDCWGPRGEWTFTYETAQSCAPDRATALDRIGRGIAVQGTGPRRATRELAEAEAAKFPKLCRVHVHPVIGNTGPHMFGLSFAVYGPITARGSVSETMGNLNETGMKRANKFFDVLEAS